jgi:uncharacterized membrane protein
MIGFPLYFLKRPPKKINSTYGYRTPRSMKNQELWDLANSTWSKSLFKYSLWGVAIQMILWAAFNTVISLFAACFLWLIAIGVAFYETEKQLNKYSKK